MEYIWTRPLTENCLLHWRGQARQHRLFLFWLFVSVVFQADSFFFSIALLLSILSSTYETFFFSVHFVISSPSYAAICCCKTLFFFIFYDSTYIPLYQTWNQKEAARRGDFFSLFPFFKATIYCFSSFCFLLFLLWRETERREGQMCTYANCSKKRKKKERTWACRKERQIRNWRCW
ncbi:hypothetical protein GGI35DRAFT_358143 [Trichoderma velutinum]